jgi:phosphoribosylcarboxyaminoimidazole (NCAIR) mutase
MSTLLKVLVVVVIIAGIGLAAYLGGYIQLGAKKPVAEQPVQTATTTAQQIDQPIAGMSATNDASDAALLQDVGAIDTQIQELTKDSTSLDTSFTDKPVTQAY